jgi:RimJ/RimL family protein N-acetyltransferase
VAFKCIPYRVITTQLVLRCWDVPDAPEFREVIARNREHLMPWMPWAQDEPQTISEKVGLVRRFRGNFDLDKDYVYAAFLLQEDGKEGRLVGGTGLHPRVGKRGLETGYWVDKDHLRRGIATEMTGAMTRVAFEWLGIHRLEAHVDVRNEASLRVPPKLGFTTDGRLRRRSPSTTPEDGDLQLFTMYADEYPESAARLVDMEAFDPLGERML